MADILMLFSSPAADWWLNGDAPSVAMTGDSWAAGQGGGTEYSNPAAGQTAQPAYWMRQTLGESFTYKVWAVGGTTYAPAATTYVPDAVASGAKAIICIAGGNDLVQGRTWSQIEADLDAIAGLIGPGQHLFIVDIPPARVFSDALCVTARGWGANELPTWAAANNATLIPIRAGMAQIRPSTGELDDLHDDYYEAPDGNHPAVPVGTQALAAILLAGLEGYYT